MLDGNNHKGLGNSAVQRTRPMRNMRIEISAVAAIERVTMAAEVEFDRAGKHKNHLLAPMLKASIVLKFERRPHDKGLHCLEALAGGEHFVVVPRRTAATHERRAFIS